MLAHLKKICVELLPFDLKLSVSKSRYLVLSQLM